MSVSQGSKGDRENDWGSILFDIQTEGIQQSTYGLYTTREGYEQEGQATDVQYDWAQSGRA